MVGAVLTQNTSWTNVERALQRMKGIVALEAAPIAALPVDALADAVRPAGYYNVKAQRLQALCRWVVDQGDMEVLHGMETQALRTGLLGVHGVGPETADDIVLYAFGRPVFVIDAYTRRLFARLGFVQGHETYEDMREHFERALPHDPVLYNEYHALIVEHAKTTCRTRPLCQECILRPRCRAVSFTGPDKGVGGR
ncbi:endonuclease III domain-containing protein [Acidiferrobacter sp.]|jgi:endonuclease-3 related protein|uniref:Endonuclease n=1 Tax=Acidiferrobacter thiooxydans TaxID=163359 RepID=A0A368HFH9_9GAMM|nr:endonuclease [Acidiferrobacter sp.]RCN57148.1 endonuclease [Acidiferrobacter thiooxydans]